MLVTLIASGPRTAVELDDASRSIVEFREAIKNFVKRDFDAYLKQLAQARMAHPELPPPHALFAKLAFLANQGSLIRPALESAIGEDPEHPEVYILFGNLALAEGRLITMAWLFTRSGNIKKAEEWIGYANKAGAESLAVQMETAAWLMEQGRPDEAQSHVDAAAKLKPGAIEIKRLLGLLSRQRKDFAHAEQIFDALANDASADV